MRGEAPEAATPLFCPSFAVVLWLGLALGIAQRVWWHSQSFILGFGLSDNSVHADPENTRTSTRFQAASSEIFFRSPHVGAAIAFHIRLKRV